MSLKDFESIKNKYHTLLLSIAEYEEQYVGKEMLISQQSDIKYPILSFQIIALDMKDGKHGFIPLADESDLDNLYALGHIPLDVSMRIKYGKEDAPYQIQLEQFLLANDLLSPKPS